MSEVLELGRLKRSLACEVLRIEKVEQPARKSHTTRSKLTIAHRTARFICMLPRRLKRNPIVGKDPRPSKSKAMPI